MLDSQIHNLPLNYVQNKVSNEKETAQVQLPYYLRQNCNACTNTLFSFIPFYGTQFTIFIHYTILTDMLCITESNTLPLSNIVVPYRAVNSEQNPVQYRLFIINWTTDCLLLLKVFNSIKHFIINIQS